MIKGRTMINILNKSDFGLEKLYQSVSLNPKPNGGRILLRNQSISFRSVFLL